MLVRTRTLSRCVNGAFTHFTQSFGRLIGQSVNIAFCSAEPN